MKVLEIKIQRIKEILNFEGQQEIIIQKLFSKEVVGKVIINSFKNDKIKFLVFDEVIETILNRLLSYKLNDDFRIGNQKIVIKEIKLLTEVQETGNYFNKDKIKIIFKSPVTFKIGNNFLSELTTYYFFQLITKQYNNFFKEGRIILDKEELEKIKVSESEIQIEKLIDEKMEITIFTGSLEVDFSEVSSKEKEKYIKILEFSKIKGIGYKYKKNYGQIEIN